ncbi:energy transducer TonB [Aurantibacter sp.]|uniref:energy transducer TonB n=1 Tax=Aurantibacter sp. TaxID=2807103 RepID=UPI0035C78F0B
MKYLKNKHEKNSARITTLIMLLIILLLFLVTSPPYMDPPEEYGVAVNFGNSNVGSGDVQPNEPIKSENNNSPEPFKEPTKTDPVEEVKPEETKQEAAAQKVEDVLTQETEEAIAIKKQKEITDAKAKAESDAKAKAKAEAEKIAKAKAEAAEKKRQEEAAKKAKLDAMMGGLNESDGTTNGGEGDDDKAGDKGQLNGNPYASSYFGDKGTGNGGVGYGLNGRGKPSLQVFKQTCNEAGLVVVMIEVDRNGKVIKATPGVKGTENTASCLLEPAKRIALSHKWKSDTNAPIRQIGFVSVNFKLGQ